MRVVVTGASSFIGKAAVRELLAEGHQVFGIIRPGSKGEEGLRTVGREIENTGKAEMPRLCIIPCELARLEDLTCLPQLSQEGADLWLHLGWDGAGSANRQDPELQARNIGYALEAVRTAGRLGCRRFLFTGSQAEYGVTDQVMGEDLECHPVSEYGKDKVKVCQMAGPEAERWGMEYIHARIFSIYGPGDHPWSLVSACIASFLEGRDMEFGDCTQQWNFLHVKDGAKALASLLLAKGPGGVYNVAGEDTRPLRDYIEEIHRLCGGKGRCLYGRRPPNAEGVVSLRPDIGKLKEAVGFSQEISFEQGIRGLIQEFQQE